MYIFKTVCSINNNSNNNADDGDAYNYTLLLTI